MKREQIHQQLYNAFAILCVCVLPFSKWLSSVSIILMAVNWLVEGKFKAKWHTLTRNPTALLMIGFFGCSAAGLLFTSDIAACQFSIQKKLSFLILGIVLGSIHAFDTNMVRQLFYWFTASLSAASLYCFLMSLYGFSRDGSIDHFFYHSLGLPIHFHAVYFSVWIFIALFFIIREILFEEIPVSQKRILLLIFVWFSIFLILLSSKLVIIIFVISLMIILSLNMIKYRRVKPVLIIGSFILVTAATVLFTKNAVSRRFDDIRDQHISILDRQHRQFTTATYFNGLSLRILLWKFGIEILHERHAWYTGVSGGDTQRLLNEKIIRAHMYTGEIPGEKQGYLNYNFHNQFIESIVQSGIAGLLFLISLIVVLLFKAIRSRDILFILCTIIFLSFFWTESVLENQKGIIPFVLFSLIFSSVYTSRKKGETLLK